MVFVTSTFVARARNSFSDTLERLGLGVGETAGSAEELGRRAALLVGAEQVWDRHLGPALTADQVATVLGVSRQAIHDRAQRGGLLALHSGGRRVRFPAFQLVDRPGATTKHVLPGLQAILTVFRAAGVDEWTVASWFNTVTETLDATTPARWLAEGREPARVLGAARRSAARLGQ
jgi:hypothetical protein